jgi:BTB/POZ domain
MSRGTPSETVQFDVGGAKYKVSKALIELYPTTMLARLVSETWQPGNTAEEDIFIDRDGSTFRHVLCYMRDQKVYLPINNISKKTILHELAYFGFENVPDDAIDGGCARITAAQSVVDIRKKHFERMEVMTFTLHYEVLAYECYWCYINTGQLFLRITKDISFPSYMKAPKIPSWNQTVLDQCLSEYGLASVAKKYHLNHWVEISFVLA